MRYEESPVPTIVLIMVIASFAATAGTQAEEPTDPVFLQRRAVLATGKEVHGDYFAFGPDVEISGIVNGDVYAAGGDVLVDGVINGDLIVTGGTIVISGTVMQDIRVAGGQVTVSGLIGRNSTIVGGRIHLSPSAEVHGELVAAAGDMELEGEIGRQAKVAAGTVTVSAHIGRTLTVAARSIGLTSNAVVDKHFRYWSATEASIDERAKVFGRIIREEMPESLMFWNIRNVLAGFWLSLVLINFTSTLMLGLLLIHVSPAHAERVGSTLAQRPGASVGWGAVVCVTTPIVATLVMMTLVGIPLGLFLLGLYLISLYIARIYVIAWAGQRLAAWFGKAIHPGWAFVSGLVLYTFLTLIPILGIFTTLSALLFGMGATVLAKQELYRILRKQDLV